MIFSAIEGQPITTAYALDLFNNAVNPYYVQSSYNKTSLAATIDPNVYRMPNTASKYANDANSFNELMNDAETLAAANNTLASYDRIVVLGSYLGSFSSYFATFSGWGNIGDVGAYINGYYSISTVAHELGHNYGLNHANLWQVTDGNPVSPNGTSVEYGDRFEIMGSGGSINDHFNPWHKYQLGWIPSQAVNSIVTSGTYRVYCFDNAAATSDHALAAKISRDGVRNYWIGLRQNYPGNASLTSGAYIFWGYSGIRQSDLLDLTTPGTDVNDCALAPGATVNDLAYGISIQNLGVGGTAPNQYIDIQVTLAPAAAALPATDIGQVGFAANWTGAWAIGATAYRLDVATDSAFTQFVSGYQNLSITHSVTSYPVTGLTPGTTYYYRVRTERGLVVSPSSAPITVTTATGVFGSAQNVNLGGSIVLAGVDSPSAGSTFQWTHNLRPIAGATSSTLSVNNCGPLSRGFYQVTAIAPDGKVSTKGMFLNVVFNTGKVVVFNAAGDRWGRDKVPSDLGAVTDIAVGYDNILALRSDGTARAWGGNASGDSIVPIGLNNVVQIAEGNGFTLALKSDGTVVAWGENSVGECDVPPAANNIVAVAAGYGQSIALKSDGTVISWGNKNIPAATAIPPGLDHVVAVAAANGANFVVKSDGSVVALGSVDSFDLPPANLDHVVAIASQFLDVCALKDDGTVVAWGDNTEGEDKVPAGLSEVAQVVAGDGLTLVIKGDGSLVGWGRNPQGPVRLPSLVPLISSNLLRIAVDSIGGSAVIAGILDQNGTPVFVDKGIQDETASAGGSTTFTATVTDATSYQWQVSSDGGGTWANLDDNGGYSGSSTAALTVSDLTLQMNGLQYRLVASGLQGHATSAPASLAVYDPTSARLINLSTRSFVGTGENIQIAGFIINGTAPKTVLIRAGGPSLSPYGVSNFLADPMLTVYAGQNIIATNDDWDPATIEPAQTALNTSTWTAGSKDAALLLTLAPGGYTAQVSGKNGGTGVALVEVYEYDRTQSTALLTNISTRSFVGTGENIQIAGFIISGAVPKKVLIRAGGPSLASFGVAAPLADPVLQLYSGSTLMTSNDNWDAATIGPVVAQANISPWASGSADAALVLTLPPGGYTAQVSGKNNGTGVALIEVYEVH